LKDNSGKKLLFLKVYGEMQNFIVRAEKYLKLTKKKSKLAFKKKIIMDKRQ